MDVKKLDIERTLSATSLKNCDCANNQPSCLSEDIKEQLGDIASIKESIGCRNESCLLKSEKVRSIIGRSRAIKELSEKYKVAGPKNTTELLNNDHIDQTLHLWVQEFPDFYPCKFAMMDFRHTREEFEVVDVAALFSRKIDGITKRVFGCVLNTDVSTGRGKHWVSMVINTRDMNDVKIMYYNSTGNAPPKQIVEWMERRRKELLTLNSCKHVDVISVTRVCHQQSDTECGLYSLYFIRCMLDGTPHTHFTKNIITDEAMIQFRKLVFR